MMEFLSLNMAAGETKVLNIAGRYLEILDAQYPISIGFVDRNGNALEDGGITNAEAGIFVNLAPVGGYAAFTVQSATAQPIRLLIGSGLGGSRRQPGVVSVVDGSRSRVLAGSSFTAAFNVSAGAGQRAKAGLWNPAGTGRRAIVKRVYVASSTSPETILLALITAAPATIDVATWNKLASGSASTAIRRGFEATAGNTGNTVALLNVRDSRTESFNFDDPWILTPGTGLLAQSTVDASSIWVTVEFVEEAI